jgi:hypothetical protein
MSALRLVKGAYGRILGPCVLLYVGRIVQRAKSGCRVVFMDGISLVPAPRILTIASRVGDLELETRMWLGSCLGM